MAYNGADIDHLRSAATQFDSVASALEGVVKAVNSSVTGPWWGSDADRFRSQWSGVSQPNVKAAVSALREGALNLRRNAQEQEQVSNTAGARLGVAAPVGTAQLFAHIDNYNKEGDGVRIEKVVGADGKTRLIVYFQGMNTTENRTLERNVPLLDGKVDPTVIARIREVLKDSPDGAKTDIMLVGFSQGGIDAQNVAAQANGLGFHVTNLVTYGSPVITPDLNGVQTVHLHGETSEGFADWVPAAGSTVHSANTVVPGVSLFTGIAGLANQSPLPWNSVFESKSDVPIGKLFETGYDHTLLYPDVANDFDKSSDSRFTDVKASMQKFQGTIVDVSPSQDSKSK
ncbi:hypothetical protein ACRDU6_04110 [Mycolicibacterium sp. ELW1]|uniref:PGAP1-like alpha/beta domain-containing protein n=1 Tax=Mycobacteriaceae TaxID=1762 RepID=UPI0011EE6917|nr:hypothetical protein [Mycobacterium sp. ELW1]QEN11964.1 hypothetical protein D3H54_00700 [Mycobacterium sp. ELW1]